MRSRETAWEAAAVLHHEAHGAGSFTYCTVPSCVRLKDVLHSTWRENRPVVPT